MIVQRLARFATPTEASEAVKEEFGLDVPRQQCALYDPDNAVAKDLSQKWRDLFWATRKQFQERFARIGIQHRAVRLEVLDDMMRKARRAKNYPLAAQLLKQAAEEVGDVYTNKRESQLQVEQINSPQPIGADRLAHLKERYRKKPDNENTDRSSAKAPAQQPAEPAQRAQNLLKRG